MHVDAVASAVVGPRVLSARLCSIAIWTSSSSLRLLYRLYSSCPMARCLPRALISVAILSRLSPRPPEERYSVAGGSSKPECPVRRPKPSWSLTILQESNVHQQRRLYFPLASSQSFSIHSCPLNHPDTHSSVHLSILLSSDPSTHLSHHPSIHSLTCPIYSFSRVSFCLPSTHLPTQTGPFFQ